MKYIHKFFIIITLLCISIYSCTDLDDKLQVPADLEVENFIWKGMNLYYLWQEDVPDLDDNKFSTQDELNVFLKNFNSPEQLFSHLRTDPSIDKFSWMVKDYTVLENSFQGIYKSNGIEYGLKYISPESNKVMGYVKYIIPNSDAESKNVKRGDIFYAINDIELTDENYIELLDKENYTLNFATMINGLIVPNGIHKNMTKYQISENPILKNKVFEVQGKKIGYLMYNAFSANYDTDLNEAFGSLKNANVTELILDLRYNSGGSVLTSARLASMITGQFTGSLFAKQKWNSKIQNYFEEENPDRLINNFVNNIEGANINSLNLSRIYILTTGNTASASELVINGLKPYINVIQIGTKTIGKNVGSITLYDSPNFSQNGRSNKHKYAMQPLTFKIVNSEGFGEYQSGLLPDYEIVEDLSNMGELGNLNENYLAYTINLITNQHARNSLNKNVKTFTDVKEQSLNKPLNNEMYLTKFEFPEQLHQFLIQ